MDGETIDIIQVSGSGQESHWRSLDELATDEASRSELKAAVLDRFPTHFLSRREFMEWTSGLIAVLGLSACTRQPRERILPYSKMPENVVPGKPLFFATTYAWGGEAMGLLVESHMGRPTKVEGNPDHPASLGATDAIAQASILDLYDPDRIQVPRFRGITATWEKFEENLAEHMGREAARAGEGLRLLTGRIVSPSLAGQIDELLRKFPQAKWVVYEPFHSDNAKAGARIAFGTPVDTHYDFSKADVIVSFDGDFFAHGGGHLRYSRQFAARRRAGSAAAGWNRFYAIESTPSVTGSVADHRWAAAPSEISRFALALAARLGVSLPKVAPPSGEMKSRVDAVADDLLAHRGASAVLVGAAQPPEIHAVVCAINAALGNVGKTVFHTEVVESLPDGDYGLTQLTDDMMAGKVGVLVALGGNPAFSAPASVGFAAGLSKVPFTVHHTVLENETSVACSWQIPATHFLEHWSDATAFDGTRSIVQPLIAPLYTGKSPHELLALLSGANRTGFEIVSRYWKTKLKNFSADWDRAIHDGVVRNSAFTPKAVSIRSLAGIAVPADPAEGFEISLRPDPTIWDGRFGNNAWLQELPKPMTKLTWDNAFFLAPAAAQKLGVKSGDNVRVSLHGRSVEGPAWVLPGQPENCVTVTAGYGRNRAGRVGSAHGFNAYPLLAGLSRWDVKGAELAKGSGKVELATTQHHFSMEGRDIVRSGAIQQFEKNPEFLKVKPHHKPELQRPKDAGRPFEDEKYAWGMAIDLSACNGCNACVVACQSENNIPVVGKEEVLRGREMHWLRIDRYYQGAPENPVIHSMPVPCMHCEAAPCEVVCPVNATTHSPEGINEMTYNRCVGTKYCSNNCPYKVRRFNFFHYADTKTPTIQLSHNPDVTVRGRGVMEKCTYCVQRVNHARIEAKRENRTIADGEFTTACASACAPNAITFGNVKNKESQVSKAKAGPLNYGLLEELGTMPRTTYLARLRNPNPKLEPVADVPAKGGH